MVKSFLINIFYIFTSLYVLTNFNLHTEIKKSVVSFTNIIKLDPYRIDNFDLLSNLMYVFDNREELIALSKHVASIDRYRQETLCVLGMILISCIVNFKTNIFLFINSFYK